MRHLRSKQKGATVIEYALVASLIALLAIGGMQMLGGNIDNALMDVNAAFQNN